MLKGFKDFILRGNVVDLAIAVVIGAAFGAVVSAFATDFIGSLIAAVGGVPNLDEVGPSIGKTQIVIGTTLTALLNFLIVSAVVYFAIVVPMTKLMEMRRTGQVEEVTATPEDIALLQEIRDLLKGQAPGGTDTVGTKGV
jgi:large conductance mechanosensitive channel